MKSEDGVSSVSASHVDGSIRSIVEVGEPPLDRDGKQIGPVPETVTTLIMSDTGMVNKVLQVRADIDKEEEEAKKAERDGKPVKKGLRKAVLGKVWWGKAGRRQQQAMAKAKAHRGEVKVSVTDRGVVVSVPAAGKQA